MMRIHIDFQRKQIHNMNQFFLLLTTKVDIFSNSPGKDIEGHRLSNWLSTLVSSPKHKRFQINDNIVLNKNYNLMWKNNLISPILLISLDQCITSLRMLRQTLPSRSMLGWYTFVSHFTWKKGINNNISSTRFVAKLSFWIIRELH